MDNLKLSASPRIHQKFLNVVEEFSSNMSIQYGIDKCRVLLIIREQKQSGGNDIETGQKQ